jgi:hypothetical protein
MQTNTKALSFVNQDKSWGIFCLLCEELGGSKLWQLQDNFKLLSLQMVMVLGRGCFCRPGPAACLCSLACLALQPFCAPWQTWACSHLLQLGSTGPAVFLHSLADLGLEPFRAAWRTRACSLLAQLGRPGPGTFACSLADLFPHPSFAAWQSWVCSLHSQLGRPGPTIFLCSLTDLGLQPFCAA